MKSLCQQLISESDVKILVLNPILNTPKLMLLATNYHGYEVDYAKLKLTSKSSSTSLDLRGEETFEITDPEVRKIEQTNGQGGCIVSFRKLIQFY